MTNKQIFPKKFINLHSHDGFSTYDGMGLPSQHFDFVIENSRDELEIPAMAITNHGHMNSYAHAYLYARDLNKAGKHFKYIPGCELYVHPDLKQWRLDKEAKEEAGDDAEHGSVVENEEETKSNKFLDPIRRVHHLVVLAKHSDGLQKLFHTISRGFLEGFYKKPRVDYGMLKQYKGNFIASTACLGGPLCYDVFSEFPHARFDVRDVVVPGEQFLGPHLVDDDALREKILIKLENTVDRIVDAFGRENTYLELQFNKLTAQQLANRMLIELSKRTGLKLVATADSHYCKPEVWRERAIYQKLGWLNYTDYDPSRIPQSIAELKAELYPKNAKQMWDAYKQTSAGHAFYDDDGVCEAIERTHEIAFEQIGDVQPDTSSKLPSWSTPKGKTADQALREMCDAGMQKLGLLGMQKYIDRLSMELRIIEEKKFAEYFLTMKAIIDVAYEKMLIGCGRGSSAGSLVNYLLGITQVDPLKYGLIFERFLTRQRTEAPDIDSDFADRDLLIKLLKDKFGDLNVLPISNYNTFQLKSLVKDVSRFFHHEGDEDGLDFQSVNAVLGPLDDEVRKRVLKQGDDKNLFELKLDDAMQHSERFREFMDAHPEVLQPISVLLHENRSLGKHASGLIVSENVIERMPVIMSKKDVQTPWVEGMHNKHLNELSWIKFDCLGLETLRIIERAVELLLSRRGGKKLRLEFDEGVAVECFENEEVLLTNGSWKRVGDLTARENVAQPLRFNGRSLSQTKES